MIPKILSKIIGDGGGKILDSIGKILDNVITNKEELEAAKLETQKVVNQHMQEMYKLSNEQFKAEIEDKDSARRRETEFIKATGHVDWMHTIVGLLVMFTFIITTYLLFTQELPEKSEHITINLVGILEGAVITVVGYYFGSSAASREKNQLLKKP